MQVEFKGADPAIINMTGGEPRSSKKMKGLKRKKKLKKEEKKFRENDEDCKITDKEIDPNQDLHPIGYYVSKREEMITEVFRVITGEKLKAMLPPVLKDIPMQELKSLCLDQLEGMSKKRIHYILAGREMDSSSDTEEDSEEERGNRAQKEKPHRQPADSTSGDTREGEEPQQSETTREANGSPSRAASDHDADTLQIGLDMDEMQDFMQDDCNQRKKYAKRKKNVRDSETEKNKCRSPSEDAVPSSSKKGSAGELKRKSVDVPLEVFNETKDKKKVRVSEKDEKKAISKGHGESVSFQKSRKKDERTGLKRRSEEDVHMENSKHLNTHVEGKETVNLKEKKHFQGKKNLDKFPKTVVKKSYDDDAKQKTVTEETEELKNTAKLEKEVGTEKEKDKSVRDKGEKEKKKKGKEEEEDGEVAKGKTLMELLELEMRARAIKSLLQRGEFAADKESNEETEGSKNEGQLTEEKDKELKEERKSSKMKAVKNDENIVSSVEELDDSESREEGEVKDDEDQVVIMEGKEEDFIAGKRERKKENESTGEKKNKIKEWALNIVSPHRVMLKDGSCTDMERGEEKTEKQGISRCNKNSDLQYDDGINKKSMKVSVHDGSKTDETRNNKTASSDDSKERDNQKIKQGQDMKEMMKVSGNKKDKIIKIRSKTEEERDLRDAESKKMNEKDKFVNGNETVKKKTRQYRQRADSSSGSEVLEHSENTNQDNDYEKCRAERYCKYSTILQSKNEKNNCLGEENKNNRNVMKKESVGLGSFTGEHDDKIFKSIQLVKSVNQVERRGKRKVKGSDMNREDGECDSSTDDMNGDDSGTEESDEISSNDENKIKIKATEKISMDSEVKNNKNLIVESSKKGENKEETEGKVREICIEITDCGENLSVNETKNYDSGDTKAIKDQEVHCTDQKVNNDFDKREVLPDTTKDIRSDAGDGSHVLKSTLSLYVKSDEEPDGKHSEVTLADSSVDLERATSSDNELAQEAFDSRNVQREREECKSIQMDEVQVSCSTTDVCDNMEMLETVLHEEDSGKAFVQNTEIVEDISEIEPENHQKDRQISDFYGNVAENLTEELDTAKERLTREISSGTVKSELLRRAMAKREKDTTAENEAEWMIKDEYIPESPTANIKDHTGSVEQENIVDRNGLEEKQEYLKVQEKDDKNENSLEMRKDMNAKKIQKSIQRAVKEKLGNSDREKNKSDCTIKFVTNVSKIDAVPVNITQETRQDQNDKINQGELEQTSEDGQQLSVEGKVSIGSSSSVDEYRETEMEQTKKDKKYSDRQSASEKDRDKNFEVLTEIEPEQQGFHVTRKTVKPELDQVKAKGPELYICDIGESKMTEKSRNDSHMEETKPNSEEGMLLVYKPEESLHDSSMYNIKGQKWKFKEVIIKEEKDRGKRWQKPVTEIKDSENFNEKPTRKSQGRGTHHAKEHEEKQLEGTECEMKDIVVKRTVSPEIDTTKQIEHRSRRKTRSNRKSKKESRNSKSTTTSPKKVSKKEKLKMKQIKQHKKVGSCKKSSKSEFKPENTQEQETEPQCQKTESPVRDRKCRSEKSIEVNKKILHEVKDISKDILKNLSPQISTVSEGQSTQKSIAENDELNETVKPFTSKQKDIQKELVTYLMDNKETYRADTPKDDTVMTEIQRDDVISPVISESSKVSDRITEEIANKENAHLEIISEVENREHVDSSHIENRMGNIVMKDAVNNAGWDTDDEELFAAAFDRESKAEDARLEGEPEKVEDEIPNPYPYKLSYMEKVALLQKKTRMIDNLFPEEKSLDESEEKLATENIAETTEEAEMIKKSELNSNTSELNSDLSEEKQRKKNKKERKEKKKSKEQEMEGIGYWKELCTNRGDFVEPELEEEHKDGMETALSSVVMDPVEKQDVTGQEEKKEDNPFVASKFTGAKNITWSERWFHSQRVQKVVNTSRMFGKIRHKMKSMKKKDDYLNKTKEEEPKSSEELLAIIGSIEEYESLFGKKVVIQEKTETETKESECVEEICEAQESRDTESVLGREMKSAESDSASLHEDGNLTHIIQTGKLQPQQEGQKREESDLDYDDSDEDKEGGDSEEDKLWGQIMGKD